MSTNSTSDPTQSLRHAFATFIPSFELPDASNNEFLAGVALVTLIQFTTTYHHPVLPYLRLLLAIPLTYACVQYGLVGKHEPYLNRYTPLGMSLISVFGLMKMAELCIVGFFNKPSEWPKWVSKKERDEDGKRKVIPFNPTVLGRLAYAFDLMSPRGPSLYSDRVWDFATTAIADYRPPHRLQAFLDTISSFALQYIILDFLETVRESRPLGPVRIYPVTSLESYKEQALAALIVFVHTILGTSAPGLLNTLFTMLLGAPPSAWPPLFNSPLSSCSLAELWTHRWHTFFRRSFDRLSYGILALIPSSRLGLHTRTIKLLRAVIIFGFSGLMHLFLLWALPVNEAYPPRGFWNGQMIKFFLLQPLGLLLELFVVFPLTEGFSPFARRELRRLSTWIWFLWAGRYFADAWIERGMWDYRQRYIIYSPIRGILYGRWIT